MSESRFDERLCAVCRRRAIGRGYSNRARTVKDIAWVCDDPECIEIAARTYTMKQVEFSRLEEMATIEGGADAGAYLDKLGKTDLASLTQDEWDEFCRTLVAGYRLALKTKLRDEAPF